MSDDDDVVVRNTYISIGHFIFQFSALENFLRVYVAQHIKLDDKYFDAVMTFDFALLCTVAQEVFGADLGETERQRLKGFLSRCRKLNDERIRVAHGFWVPFRDGGSVLHTSRSTLKSRMLTEQSKHLSHQALEAEALLDEIENFMCGEPLKLRRLGTH